MQSAFDLHFLLMRCFYLFLFFCDGSPAQGLARLSLRVSAAFAGATSAGDPALPPGLGLWAGAALSWSPCE